eukprot:TRINITY_DN31903_c0_g1_i1.p1 TRINITY_DN31903_c0_g1~~TRINITY_DN31903_c0_g1_i1.p1  ORF type:complete len:294 (-),score=98.07 TRINITY_DN31903_c0_g1_i1:454-1335(-)
MMTGARMSIASELDCCDLSFHSSEIQVSAKPAEILKITVCGPQQWAVNCSLVLSLRDQLEKCDGVSATTQSHLDFIRDLSGFASLEENWFRGVVVTRVSRSSECLYAGDMIVKVGEKDCSNVALPSEFFARCKRKAKSMKGDPIPLTILRFQGPDIEELNDFEKRLCDMMIPFNDGKLKYRLMELKSRCKPNTLRKEMVNRVITSLAELRKYYLKQVNMRLETMSVIRGIVKSMIHRPTPEYVSPYASSTTEDSNEHEDDDIEEGFDYDFRKEHSKNSSNVVEMSMSDFTLSG